MRLSLIALLLLLASSASAQTSILPLGDSLCSGSYGGGPANSYRKPLYDLLTSASVSFDFVGTLSTGDATLPDKDQECHPGWSTWTFGADPARLPAYVNATLPDIVLLQLGTNDAYNTHFPIASAVDELGRIMRMILALRPSAVVLVANISPINNGNADAAVRALAFNAALPGIVDYERSRGGDVRLVSIPLTNAHLVDGIHLNASGATVEAQAWFDAIMGVINPADMSGVDMTAPVDMTTPDAGTCCGIWITINGVPQCVTGNANVNVPGCSIGGAARGANLILLILFWVGAAIVTRKWA